MDVAVIGAGLFSGRVRSICRYNDLDKSPACKGPSNAIHVNF